MKLIPDHEYGFTKTYLESVLTKEQYRSLNKFMVGQTQMWDDKLNCSVIYECDIENWIHGGNLFWD